MNICLLCRNFHRDLGGIETFTLNFAKALAEAGHCAHILCLDQGNFNRGSLGKNLFIHYTPFNDHPFPGAWRTNKYLPFDDFWYSRAVARTIDKVHKQYSLDIIETFDYFRQGFVYTRRHHRIPVFLRLHGWFFNRIEGRVDPWSTLSFKEKISWWMQRDTLCKADGIAAVAADTRDFVKQVWKFNRNIKVIYNAVDSQDFSPLGEKDPCQILFAGRLIPRKGIEVLTEAMPLVVKECPDVKLAVAGADAQSNDGKTNSQMLRERIGPDHFEYLGQLPPDQIKQWFRKSAILIMPSLDEAFPMSALEAMASGCALIASAVGGVKELIRHEEDGLLVNPGNAQMLAAAIVRLLKDPVLCWNLASKGMEKVRTCYSYKRLLEESMESYRAAIQSYYKSHRS
jgi:glycogen synthase